MQRPLAPGHFDIRRFAWVGVPAFALVALIFVGARVGAVYPWVVPTADMWAYWSTRTGFHYGAAVPGHTGDYIYSPAFAHALAPLVALPWPVFAGAWTAVLLVALWWLAGRWALLVALLPPVALSIGIGQVDIVMAAAIVAGFRWPGAWALMILTKVTPGIGLLWFAARREWRSLGVALAATAAIVAGSAIIDPAAWRGWLEMLVRAQFPSSDGLQYLPVPLWIRLPLVAAFVAWGARTDRRWTVPVAVMLALPTVWMNSPALLLALPALVGMGAKLPAGAWLRSPDAEPAVVRRRIAHGLAASLLMLGAEVDDAWILLRRSGGRLIGAVRRRLTLERRWLR